MSKILPAAITAGKGGDSHRVILVRIIPESGSGSPDVWSEYDWATKGITVTDWEGGADKVFDGGVLKENAFTPITQSVDVSAGGNVATISELKIRIANAQFDEDSSGDLRFDQVTEDYDFENRTVEIFLGFPTEENSLGELELAYTDILLLYRGVILGTDYDYDTFTFTIESAATKRHRPIPDLVITPENYPHAPDSSYGKVAPLIYGEPCGGNGMHSRLEYTPLLLVDKTKLTYIINRHKSSASDNILLYYPEVDRYSFLTNIGFVFTEGSPTTVSLVPASLDSSGATSELRGDFVSQATHQGGETYSPDIDASNVTDKDVVSTTTCEIHAGGILSLKFPIPAGLGQIVDESSTNLHVGVNVTAAGSDYLLTYWNPEYDDGVGGWGSGIVRSGTGAKTYPFGGDKTSHGNRAGQEDQNERWTPEEIASYEWVIQPQGPSVTVSNVYLRIKNHLVRLSSPIHRSRLRGETLIKKGLGGSKERGMPYSNAGVDNICSHSHGIQFGAWIDESYRTGEHIEGDAIIYGAYAIESMLREDLGLGDDDINWESFDAIGEFVSPRGEWALGTMISEQKHSLTHIAHFCQQCAIIYFTDYEMKEKVVALTKADSAVKTISRDTINEDSIKVYQTPLDDVFNQFYVHFDKNFMTGAEYRWLRFCTETDNNLQTDTRDLPSDAPSDEPADYEELCAYSQTKYGFTKRLDFEADWYYFEYDGVAGYYTTPFLKWLAEWHCYRKWIVEFRTGLDHLDLELGDQVKIDHTLLPSALSNSAHFMVLEHTHDPNTDEMKFKFIQIPDLLP